MRKFILTSALILVSCLFTSAQNPLGFREQLKNNLLTFNFRYESEGNIPLAGNGTVKAQDNCYVVFSGTIEIHCDGKTKWTADTKSKEVYIEEAEDIFNFLPQLSDIRDEGGRISATHKDPSNGVVTRLFVTNLKTGHKVSPEDFTYSLPTDKNWIVTDLRAQ